MRSYDAMLPEKKSIWQNRSAVREKCCRFLDITSEYNDRINDLTLSTRTFACFPIGGETMADASVGTEGTRKRESDEDDG